jgi:putative transposase
MLSTNRDEVATTRFFKQSIESNGMPEKVVIDKSGANYAGLMNINTLLFFFGATCFIEILRVRYSNNIIEQDHRFINKITKTIMNFEAYHTVSATLSGIELAHMIRKKQFKHRSLRLSSIFRARSIITSRAYLFTLNLKFCDTTS